MQHRHVIELDGGAIIKLHRNGDKVAMYARDDDNRDVVLMLTMDEACAMICALDELVSERDKEVQ